MTIRNFLSSEGGAVTVDWVVLTAALVGLGVAVMAVLGGGFRAQSTALQVQLSRDDIICTDFCDRTTPPAGGGLSEIVPDGG